MTIDFNVRHFNLRASSHIHVYEMPSSLDPAAPESIIVVCTIHNEWQRVYYNEWVDGKHLQKLVDEFVCYGCATSQQGQETSRWPNAGEDGGAEL